jgi:SSS family solute:Na+ symporter
LPGFVNLEFLYSSGFATLVEQKDKTMAYEIPFIDRMGFVFVICVLIMILISLIDSKRGVVVKGLEVDTKMFKVSNGFAVGTMIIGGILVALYSIFW